MIAGVQFFRSHLHSPPGHSVLSCLVAAALWLLGSHLREEEEKSRKNRHSQKEEGVGRRKDKEGRRKTGREPGRQINGQSCVCAQKRQTDTE